jgi:hypothetical protein
MFNALLVLPVMLSLCGPCLEVCWLLNENDCIVFFSSSELTHFLFVLLSSFVYVFRDEHVVKRDKCFSSIDELNSGSKSIRLARVYQFIGDKQLIILSYFHYHLFRKQMVITLLRQ